MGRAVNEIVVSFRRWVVKELVPEKLEFGW
jgi:hypothetical protein